MLDQAFPTIREELLTVLPNKATIPRYHDIDPMQAYISAPGDPDKAWKIFYLYAMGDWPGQGRAACPKTAALLKDIPGLFQAFFSILEAGKAIPVHEGPYRGYLRYHLGMVVPEQDPPRSGSRTRPTPGTRGRASSSTIAGSTRSSTIAPRTASS